MSFTSGKAWCANELKPPRKTCLSCVFCYDSANTAIVILYQIIIIILNKMAMDSNSSVFGGMFGGNYGSKDPSMNVGCQYFDLLYNKLFFFKFNQVTSQVSLGHKCLENNTILQFQVTLPLFGKIWRSHSYNGT